MKEVQILELCCMLQMEIFPQFAKIVSMELDLKLLKITLKVFSLLGKY